MSLSNKIVAYLSDEYGLRESTNGWLETDCPFCCKKNKLCVNPEYNYLKCWVCDFKGDIYYFLELTEKLRFKEAVELISSYREQSYSLPTSQRRTFNSLNVFNVSSKFSFPCAYKPILDGDNHLSRLARAYLIRRKFDLEYLADKGFGYVDEVCEDRTKDLFGYIIMPFSRNGIYYYYNARNYMSSHLRYKNPSTEDFGIGKADLLWNEDALLQAKKLWIMEGVFSALTIGDDAIATMGKAVSNSQVSKILKSSAKEVVIAFDPNTWKESIDLASKLLNYKAVKLLDLKTGDPNDLGAEKLYEIEETSKFLNFGTLMTLKHEKLKGQQNISGKNFRD